MTDRPLAPLLTMTEGDYRWCRDLSRSGHESFRLVLDYLDKAITELDAQRAALAELRAKVGRLRDPFRYVELGVRECRFCGVRTWLHLGATTEPQHPNDACLYFDWLAAQSTPTPGE